jgi:hypothetical protein
LLPHRPAEIMRTILVLSYCLCLTLLVQAEVSFKFQAMFPAKTITTLCFFRKDDPILAFLTTTEKTTDPLLRLLAEETEDQIDDLSTEVSSSF